MAVPADNQQLSPPFANPAGARQPLVIAAVGFATTIALLILLPIVSDPWGLTGNHTSLSLSYLVVWVPLLGAVLIARMGGNPASTGGAVVSFAQSSAGSIARQFRWIDLLWGLGIGLLARVAATIFEIVFYGRAGSAQLTFGEQTLDAWWLFGAVLAPVIIAPVIEELYFRGLLLNAIRRYPSRFEPRTLTVAAITISTFAFAFVHLITVQSVTGGTVAGLSTLLFGFAAASLAASTGRLGGAILAHITFNALVVLPALL